MLRRLFTIALIITASITSIAQNKDYITIGAGYDLLSFTGDLTQNQKYNAVNSFRGGYNFFIEKFSFKIF